MLRQTLRQTLRQLLRVPEFRDGTRVSHEAANQRIVLSTGAILEGRLLQDSKGPLEIRALLLTLAVLLAMVLAHFDAHGDIATGGAQSESNSREKINLNWKEAGIRLSTVLEAGIIDSNSCFSSGSDLLACFSVIELMGQVAQPSITIKIKPEYLMDYPSYVLAHQYETSDMVADLGFFVLTEETLQDKLSIESRPENFEKKLNNRIHNMGNLTLFSDIASQIQAKYNRGYQFETNIKSSLKENTSDYLLTEPFRKAFIILRNRLPKDTLQSLLAASVYNTWLREGTDPHTRLELAQKFDQDLSTGSEVSYAGIGVEMNSLEGTIFVTRVLEGSGAEATGLRAGDILLSAENEPLTGKSPEQVSQVIRGQVDTSVKVSVLRNGREMEFQVPRRVLVLSNVRAQVLADIKGQNLGYIKVETFVDENLTEKVRKSILDLQDKGVRGLILDLRGNPGGLMREAVKVAGLFVGKGKTIVLARPVEESKKSQEIEIEKFRSTTKIATHLPLVVLVNFGSASASELLAGALQDYNRAWIVGTRSFGKGTMQMQGWLKQMPEVLIWHTTDVFYHPSGKTNQLEGILPEFEVWHKPGQTESDYPVIVREEDLFPNALPAPKVASTLNFVQELENNTLRKSVQERIKSCRASQSLAEKEFEDEPWSDYQLLVAQEVLLCAGTQLDSQSLY